VRIEHIKAEFLDNFFKGWYYINKKKILIKFKPRFTSSQSIEFL